MVVGAAYRGDVYGGGVADDNGGGDANLTTIFAWLCGWRYCGKQGGGQFGRGG